MLHNQAIRIDGMTMHITSWEGAFDLLRVAASSNPSIEGMPKRLRLLCTPHVKRWTKPLTRWLVARPLLASDGCRFELTKPADRFIVPPLGDFFRLANLRRWFVAANDCQLRFWLRRFGIGSPKVLPASAPFLRNS